MLVFKTSCCVLFTGTARVSRLWFCAVLKLLFALPSNRTTNPKLQVR